MEEQDDTNAAHWLNRKVQLQIKIFFLLNIFFIDIIQFCKRKIVIIILSLNIIFKKHKETKIIASRFGGIEPST